jgi:hypothetical protein
MAVDGDDPRVTVAITTSLEILQLTHPTPILIAIVCKQF